MYLYNNSKLYFENADYVIPVRNQLEECKINIDGANYPFTYKQATGYPDPKKNFTSEDKAKIHKALINEWVKYNAAAICNFKYGESKKTVDTIVNDIFNCVNLAIDGSINNYKNMSDIKLTNIIAAIVEKLCKAGVPPYLINVCRTTEFANHINNYIKIRFNNLTIQNNIDNAKKEYDKKSKFGKVISDLYDKAAEIVDKAANKIGLDIERDSEKQAKITNDIKNEIEKCEQTLRKVLKIYSNIYLKRKSIVIYIASAHSRGQSGKMTHFSHIFEWKWSRLFGDLLQAVLLEMGFTAVKVVPEADSFLRPYGRQAFTSSDMDASMKGSDSRMRGIRGGYLKKYVFENAKYHIGIIPHLNAGGTSPNNPWVTGGVAGKNIEKYKNYNGDRGFMVRTLRGIDKCDILAHCMLSIANDLGVKIESENNLTSAQNLQQYKYGTNYIFSNRSGSINGVALDPNTIFVGDNYSDGEIGAFIDNEISPTVLTENMFQDSLVDIVYLRSGGGLKQLLTIHILGIFKYLTNKISISGKFTYSSTNLPTNASAGATVTTYDKANVLLSYNKTDVISLNDLVIDMVTSSKNENINDIKQRKLNNFNNELTTILDNIVISDDNTKFVSLGNDFNNINTTVARIVGNATLPAVKHFTSNGQIVPWINSEYAQWQTGSVVSNQLKFKEYNSTIYVKH